MSFHQGFYLKTCNTPPFPRWIGEAELYFSSNLACTLKVWCERNWLPHSKPSLLAYTYIPGRFSRHLHAMSGSGCNNSVANCSAISLQAKWTLTVYLSYEDSDTDIIEDVFNIMDANRCLFISEGTSRLLD